MNEEFEPSQEFDYTVSLTIFIFYIIVFLSAYDYGKVLRLGIQQNKNIFGIWEIHYTEWY